MNAALAPGSKFVDALLREHAEWVGYLARTLMKTAGAGVPSEDILQAGMVGLWQAAKAYDSREGVQFRSFARRRVVGSMTDELRAWDYTSREGRRHANRVRRATDSLTHSLGRKPSHGEVAAKLGMSLPDYFSANACMSLRVHDAPMDTIPCEAACPTAGMQARKESAWLSAAVAGLRERDRFIVRATLNGTTLAAIGEQLGITESAACFALRTATVELASLAVKAGMATTPGRVAKERKPTGKAKGTPQPSL